MSISIFANGVLRINPSLKLLVPLLIFGAALSADTIILRNGETIEGDIVSQGRETVTINTPNGEVKLRKTNIRRIQHGESAAERQNKAEQAEAAEARKKEQILKEKRDKEAADKKRKEEEMEQAEARKQRQLLDQKRRDDEKKELEDKKALEAANRDKLSKGEKIDTILDKTPAEKDTDADRLKREEELRKDAERAELAALEREKARERERLRKEEEERNSVKPYYGSLLRMGSDSGVYTSQLEGRVIDISKKRALAFDYSHLDSGTWSHRGYIGAAGGYTLVQPAFIIVTNFSFVNSNPHDSPTEMSLPSGVDQYSIWEKGRFKIKRTSAWAYGGPSIQLPEVTDRFKFYPVAGVHRVSVGATGSHPRIGLLTSSVTGAVTPTLYFPMSEELKSHETSLTVGFLTRYSFRLGPEVRFGMHIGAGSGNYHFNRANIVEATPVIYDSITDNAHTNRREIYGTIGASMPVLENAFRIFADYSWETGSSRFGSYFLQINSRTFDLTTYFVNQYAANGQRRYTEEKKGAQLGIEFPF